MMPIDNDFLNWLAGLVAGEGCFMVKMVQQGRSQFCACPFQVKLRDDDLAILLEIQERLQMGTISRHKSRGASSPLATWTITKIDDSMRLIEIFDAHPLRAKKQRDYEIWRKAVIEVHRGRGIGIAGRGKGLHSTYDKKYLRYLANKLKMIKDYGASETDEYEQEGEQLELFLRPEEEK